MKNKVISKKLIQEKYLIFNIKKNEYVKIRKNSVFLKKDATSIEYLWTAYSGEVFYVIKFVDGTLDFIIDKQKVETKSWLEG